ncbi:hypothetical protein N0V95_005994 [Ascochyta clinopodiicola]|nr:hypothetical protein N0V95_005994 [Ascochyta clinopodiicola]
MPAYGGLTITELEADMHKMHAEVDTKLSNCSKMIAKLDAHHNNADEHYRKADMLLAEHKVVIAALHNTLAAEKLPTVELKLRTAEYMLKFKSDIRGKDAKKQLIKTMRSLTLQLAGKALPEEKDFKTENEKLKHELRILSAQLESKTEECETKDQIITDLTENFTVYQNVTPDTRIHRHDSCNELNVAFDEQCSVLTAERDIVQSNFEVLSVKHDVLAMKRDALGEECHNLRSKLLSERLVKLTITITTSGTIIVDQ